MKKQFDYIVPQEGEIPIDVLETFDFMHKKYIGKKLRVEITNERKRSNAQNRWFHKINSMITDFLRAKAKDEGNAEYYKIDEETTKIWIKQEFLGYEEIEGERKLRRTSNLKTFEMNNLWQDLQIYFSPLGLNLPDPNQTEFI